MKRKKNPEEPTWVLPVFVVGAGIAMVWAVSREGKKNHGSSLKESKL